MCPTRTTSKEALFVFALLIHASMVKFCNCRVAGLPIITLSLSPSKLNALPTTPGANEVFPTKAPLFDPTASVVLPSPFHQPTKPEKGVTQPVGGGVGDLSTACIPLIKAWP